MGTKQYMCDDLDQTGTQQYMCDDLGQTGEQQKPARSNLCKTDIDNAPIYIYIYESRRI